MSTVVRIDRIRFWLRWSSLRHGSVARGKVGCWWKRHKGHALRYYRFNKGASPRHVGGWVSWGQNSWEFWRPHNHLLRNHASLASSHGSSARWHTTRFLSSLVGVIHWPSDMWSAGFRGSCRCCGMVSMSGSSRRAKQSNSSGRSVRRHL